MSLYTEKSGDIIDLIMQIPEHCSFRGMVDIHSEAQNKWLPRSTYLPICTKSYDPWRGMNKRI